MAEQQTHTVLSLVLREYRSQHHLKQEQLATDLNVDLQTVRRWEQKEATLRDISELKRIAVLLGTDPERLGVTTVAPLPLTSEEVDKFVAHIWQFAYQARVAEAQSMAKELLQELVSQIKGENDPLLYRLAQVHHVAGFVSSMRTRQEETESPLVHYQEMEKIARFVADESLLTLALAYEGDMHCRGGNTSKGIRCLDAARETAPQADLAAKGYIALLLGRAYLKSQRVTDFEREMAEAERLAASVVPGTNPTYGQLSLGSVYAEYGYSYVHLERFHEAIEYLDRAEKHLEHTTYWEILLKTARAVALVQNGDFHHGIPLAIESIELCRKQGTLRLLERMYALRRYLHRISFRINQVSIELQEVLDGPLEPPY